MFDVTAARRLAFAGTALFSAALLAGSTFAADPPVAAPKTMDTKAVDSKAMVKSTLTDAQSTEIKQLVHDYIIQNPEIIAEAIGALRDKQEAAKTAKQKDAVAANHQDLLKSTEGTVIGNAKGDVTIVEFFDYNCGYCKGMFPAMMETLKDDGHIRLILKEFPILGPSSLTASKAALASVKQGKYSAFHQALMGHKGALTDDTVFEVAKDTGLDVPRLQKDMNAPEVQEVIDHNLEVATNLQIAGTPAVIVGDEFVNSAMEKDQIKDLVSKARTGK